MSGIDAINLNIYLKARQNNINNIESRLIDIFKDDSPKKALCLGCADGNQFLSFFKKIKNTDLYGIEIEPDNLQKATDSGINAIKSDLNDHFPFDDNVFDIVLSNQVIEHILDTDNFISEMYRVCKNRGCGLISTENLASWDNIFALLLGYQAFSQNISHKISIGNPISPGYRRELNKNWQHKIIFTTRGLYEMMGYYGFKDIQMTGSGYTPLGSIDVYHARLITAIGFKN